MTPALEYAKPRHVDDVSTCFFYHVMELPGVGVVGEHWDLRETVDQYLGPYEYRGKRVLDVGAGSGFLTFEMEKRGADVVSFDLGQDSDWDIVPYAGKGPTPAEAAAAKKKNVESLLNSYWMAHRLLGSKAKAFYGNIYALPEELGPFDAVFLGAVLLHLRDPFLALNSASLLSTDAVIITDLFLDSTEPVMRFLPEAASRVNRDTWWQLSQPCLVEMLAVLGFTVRSITRFKHKSIHGEAPRMLDFSTLVASRRE